MQYTKMIYTDYTKIRLIKNEAEYGIPTDPKNSDYKQYLYYLNEATPEELAEAGVTFAPDENL